MAEKLQCNEKITFRFDNKIYFKIKSLLKCKCQFFFPECKEIDQEIKKKGAKGKKDDRHG